MILLCESYKKTCNNMTCLLNMQKMWFILRERFSPVILILYFITIVV